MNNKYQFFTEWHIPDATLDEVWAVIADVNALPEWWPSVYLEITPRESEGELGVFDLHTKGWLPYTLRWRLTVLESQPPTRSVIGARGDFDGQGIWTLWQDGNDVRLTFDWRLLAEKPLLRTLSPVLKPAFAANHRWAMAQGEVSLAREVRRRRGLVTPPPPGPTTYEPWAVALGVIAVGVVFGVVLRKKK